MTFSESVTTCFRKYVTFSGRATRSEFWYFVLFNVIVGIVVGFLDSAFFGGRIDETGPLESMHSLVIFLPAISVQVRRLHDLDKSGWWYFMWLIPVIGWIALLVWNATEGSFGDNRFGPSTRNEQSKPDTSPPPEPERPVEETESNIPSVKRTPTIRRR